MNEPVTSSTSDAAAAVAGPRDLQDDDEEDEITAMQRSIQEDLPMESESEDPARRTERASTSIDSVEEIRQYIVYVQDDGTILLDKKGVMPQDADPTCVIPLRLPVNKLADPDDPLPGAVHVSYRQTKQKMLEQTEMQTLRYNADTGEVIGGANRLEEGDLEWVQMNPTIDGGDNAQVVQEAIKEEKAEPEATPTPEPPEPTPASVPLQSTSAVVTSPAPTPQPALEPPKSSSQTSASAARARRSLRQADRAEKQEAERILAENKQMLQREKEQMENSKLPLNTVTPSGHVVGISSAPAVIKKEKDDDVDSAKKNPKRTRKMPAHLTDPNYIHPLDDQSEDIREPEDAEEPEEEEVDEADDVDDPNKLWCICRRPHNNRFMIQCDSCEDWFHGKCVGVTKAQGKVIEESELQWHCPACKKKLKDQEARNRLSDKKAKAFGKTPEATKFGRNSTSSLDRTMAKDRRSEQTERRSSTFSPDIVDFADDIKKERNSSSSSGQKNEDIQKKGKSMKSETSCVGCGGPARNGSLFCSNKCVMEKAKLNTPEGQQRKKELGKKDSAGDSFLSFHKLQASNKEEGIVSSSTERSSKSPGAKTTESIAKSWDGKQTAKLQPIPKASTLQTSSGESKKPTSDSGQALISTGKKRTDNTEKVQKKDESHNKSQTGKANEMPTKDLKGNVQKVPLQKQNSVEERNSQSQKPPTQLTQQKSTETQKQLDPNKKGIDGKTQQRDPNKKSVSDGKARDPTRTSSGTLQKSGNNQLVRSASKTDDEKSRDEQKIKKSISEQKSASQKSKDEVQKPSQQRTSLERKKSETSSNSSSLNSEPLLRQNMKRSLQAILQEKLKEAKVADATVDYKANPETLAVEIDQELINLFGTAGNPKCKAKFRTLLFNLKNTRSTLATNLLTLSLSPSQLVRMDSSEMAPAELTEWRLRENQRELEAIKRSELDKLTEAKKQELIEKGAEMDVVGKVAVVARQELEGVIAEPEDGKKEKKTPSDEKKDDSKAKSHKKKKHHRDRHHRERDESLSSREKSSLSREKESESITDDNRSLKRSSSVLSEEPKGVWPELPTKEKYEAKFSLTSPRELSPTLPELPSSTIKTPDFSPPQTASASSPAPLFKTKLIMPELGSLNAAIFHVSHPQLEGTLFPESPVPIVGRISPETVWDYIDKMKKSKELIVLRLAPASSKDADAYMTFFSYLASRGRFGVLGGIGPPLKDVYLVPLDKHSPVNRSLLPFHGPGLPTERAHCLLAVVTRAVESGHRLRLEVRHSKRPKIEPKPEPPPSNEDEDKPYEPWEGEDDEEEVQSQEKGKVVQELRKLDEQIAKRKQEIESILVATSRNVDLAKVGGIPGLDGEFDDLESEIVESIQEPEVGEVKENKTKETEPIEIVDEDKETKEPAKEEKMEVDEGSPSPITILDSPPTPEPPPPGPDDFRPLKKHPVEELSEDLFEGSTLKQPLGKKIEINIKGVFPAAERQTSHGDIDERQPQPEHTITGIPPGGAQASTSTCPNAQQQPSSGAVIPLQEIPMPSEQPVLPINISVPPPAPFFMPPVALPPPPHQLPPRFPMIPIGTPPSDMFPMTSQPPPGFPPAFPPRPGMTASFPSAQQQGTDVPLRGSSGRPERFHSNEPETSEANWDDGQRVSRNFGDSPRRNDSPRFGSGSYRQQRGDFHGRVFRNPGEDRARRWDNDQRRNNRARDRSPDRRDRQRRDRSRSDSRRHRRRSRSSSPRRRSRSPSPHRRNRTPSPRRRSKSPSPRRQSKSSSPSRKSSSPRRKSTSPRRHGHASRSSSSSSSSSSKASK